MVLDHADTLRSPLSWMRNQVQSASRLRFHSEAGVQSRPHGIEVEKVESRTWSQVGNDPLGYPIVDRADAYAKAFGKKLLFEKRLRSGVHARFAVSTQHHARGEFDDRPRGAQKVPSIGVLVK